MKATISFNKEETIGKVDKRIYGSFIEHLGRAVYNGIYEPDHKEADDLGFRKDVIDLVKKLNVPIVRYPGGNFVSGYNWEDGTGPRDKRPRKLELAWESIETNQVGIDEFQEWAKRADSDVMMAVNLGTRGPEEARQLVEYCNLDTDTVYANKRKENGFEKPFGIKLWCLGNEMDGPWQICGKTANEYARIATETAKMMKWVDPSIELVACGSSNLEMPTFGIWEKTVLEATYPYIDYLSLHSYYGNRDGDTAEFFAKAVDMDSFITQIETICDEVQAEKGTDKQINLSFDEWNVWYHSNDQDKEIEPWQIAPPKLEDVYNLEDAVMVGSMMIVLLNHCDRVKIACLAQLVNVIAPIMTEIGGNAWAQTIYYPFMYTSAFGRGTALKVSCDAGTYDTKEHTAIPNVDGAAVLSEDEKTLTLFLVNRSLTEEFDVDLKACGFDGYKVVKQVAMEGEDLQAVNDAVNRNNVVPVEKCVEGGVKLSVHSWNMIQLEK
ncbi:MAG: alpha-N-arabinofuranosidase [Lachnospiraceae bacterium]|nr:alpha-N-arabinofuranosidase [Lachnospiraceae bacterium]